MHAACRTEHDTLFEPSPEHLSLFKILCLMWSRISFSFSFVALPLVADGHLRVQFIYAAAPVCQLINPA